MKKIESKLQKNIIAWCEKNKNEYPELDLIFHIPNAGKRSIQTGINFKEEGLKPGVSDLFLPVARGGYHGFFLELKKDSKTKPKKKQIEWMEKVAKQGYLVKVYYDFKEAVKDLFYYINNEITFSNF